MDFGIRATVELKQSPPERVSLSSVTYGSYVSVLSGALAGQICIWTDSSELIPLSRPGRLLSLREHAAFRSDEILVEVLRKDTVLTITIDNNKAEKVIKES